ncbi:MAG: hypothetical protein HC938_13035 [Nitrospira sp.]|nr:hypothetical protein [Nitrospira sp.]
MHNDHRSDTPDWLGEGLRRSLLNYLERRGLDLDVRQWFDEDVPHPMVPSTWLKYQLKNRTIEDGSEVERRCVWLGGPVTCELRGSRSRLIHAESEQEHVFILPESQAQWLEQLLIASTPQSFSPEYPHIQQARHQFPGTISDFNAFLKTASWKKIRSIGFVLV